MPWEPPFTERVEETYRRLRTGASLVFENVDRQPFGTRRQKDDSWDFTITIDNPSFYAGLEMRYEPRRTPQHATISLVVGLHEDPARYTFQIQTFPGLPPMNWNAPYRHRRKLWQTDFARYAGALAYAIDQAFVPDETLRSQLYGVLRWGTPNPPPFPFVTRTMLLLPQTRPEPLHRLIDRLEDTLRHG